MKTIEEKAKAYDEALEKARQLCAYPTTKPFINDLQDLFPELTGSEDEKIRKELISYFTGWKDDALFRSIPHQKILAWLEKQGEQKEHLELKAGHWYICHRAYCCRADHLTVKEGERFQCEKDGIVKGFALKEPEKYFKECGAPAPMESDQSYMGSDEVRRRSTIQVLEYARSLDNYNQYGKEDIDKNIAWLEKQGEQNHAWSEEDEKTLVSFLHKLGICELLTSKENCWIIDSDKLKTLKERRTWKPSDEQMKALLHMKSVLIPQNLGPSATVALVDSLYDDLEKLKV